MGKHTTSYRIKEEEMIKIVSPIFVKPRSRPRLSETGTRMDLN